MLKWYCRLEKTPCACHWSWILQQNLIENKLQGSDAVVSAPQQVKGCSFDSSQGLSLWCLHVLGSLVSSHIPEIQMLNHSDDWGNKANESCVCPVMVWQHVHSVLSEQAAAPPVTLRRNRSSHDRQTLGNDILPGNLSSELLYSLRENYFAASPHGKTPSFPLVRTFWKISIWVLSKHCTFFDLQYFVNWIHLF